MGFGRDEQDLKLVRDVTGIDTWKDYLVGSATQTRFIGTVADPYRVYWGVDGNYAWSVTASVKGGQELTDAQLTEVKEKFNVLEDNAGVTFTQFGPEALNIAWRTRSIPTIKLNMPRPA